MSGEREGDVEAAVHDARKRCKKLRGLLRLVRPVIGELYAPGNRAFRDAARRLGPYRDAHALLETFDRLGAVAPGRGRDREPLAAVRDGLAADAERASTALRDGDDDLEDAAHGIEAGVERARRVRIDAAVGPLDASAVRPGLKKTYKRGHKARRTAADSASPEDFHEWRKRCKYTWYHLRLVGHAAPWVLGPLADGFHALSNTLGDAHDLHVLSERLGAEPQRYGGSDAVDRVHVLAGGVRLRLEHAALRGGAVLYAEPPGRFADRLARYWQTFRSDGVEPPLPELDDSID
nr:CHAD domain-containing protein [Wenzhouxiangella sp. XN79A]